MLWPENSLYNDVKCDYIQHKLPKAIKYAQETYVQQNAGICSALLDHCTSVIGKVGKISFIDISLV